MSDNEWKPGDATKLAAFHKMAREAQEADADADYTPEQQQAIDDWLTDGFEPPAQTAQEAEWENKAAAVEAFVAACKAVVEALDDMESLEIIGSEFEDLRSIASQAAYVFSPDCNDHSLEDLS